MNDFFASLYEVFNYTAPFSDSIYDEQLYIPLGCWLVGLTLLAVVTFYYGINRPSFSRWYHWLIVLTVNFLIQFFIGTIIPQTRFESVGMTEYSNSDFLNFALTTQGLMSVVLFVLLSFTLRWWSRNCKGTPWPN